MKKVGILTFHFAHNYGSILQAYALQEACKNLGLKPEFIDYRPKSINDSYNLFRVNFDRPGYSTLRKFLSIIYGLIIWIILFINKYIRFKKFNKFIQNNLTISSNKYLNPFKSNYDYNYYLVGSDQIWNPEITKGFDKIYYGDFNTKKQAKKIAYAASIAKYDFDSTDIDIIGHYLKKFYRIGAREDAGQKFIKDNFKIDTTMVTDPTFLIDISYWNKLSIAPKIKKKYVLIYVLGLRAEVITVARKVATEINAEIVEITGGVVWQPSLKYLDIKKLKTADIGEYLGLFRNASFIVTTSFHGTAFSIIYNKPFYSLARGSEKDSRQSSLLRDLGLEDRFIKVGESPSFSNINYDHINQIIESKRNNSLNFLKECLDC